MDGYPFHDTGSITKASKHSEWLLKASAFSGYDILSSLCAGIFLFFLIYAGENRKSQD